ncbi:RNA-guided endonuclease InsQ/TnpB family protein [Scytonema sp. NUACC21]
MLLGFKTELKINSSQLRLLAKHVGTARHAWNWGLALIKQILDHNRVNPENKIKFPSAIDLHKWLVALVKPENPWYYEVSKCAPQSALRNLATAFKDFFDKKRGFPKFKKKGQHDSFTLDGTIVLEKKRIKVPVIGWIRTHERLPFGIKPKSVTISRTANRWFISFKNETGTKSTLKTVDVVGVDLGVKNLTTLSTGETFEGAKSYRKAEKRLKRLQTNVSRRVKGSANRKKAGMKLASLHARIANIRKDTLHKLTTYLAKNHGKIVIEDLNVKGMMANRKLAKAIGDMGFYEFRRQLEYKCGLYGAELVVVDRFYPSSKACSKCGNVKDLLKLSERVYNCDACGFEIDRDLNAAINLSLYAGSSPVSACGRGAADSPG